MVRGGASRAVLYFIVLDGMTRRTEDLQIVRDYRLSCEGLFQFLLFCIIRSGSVLCLELAFSLINGHSFSTC